MKNNITIPQTLIDNLTTTNPMYTVLYMQGLLNAVKNSTTINIKETATKFNILESDVVSAWQHWQVKRLVHLTFNDNLLVEFIQPTEKASLQDTVVSNDVSNIISISETPKKALFAKPFYHPKELEMYKQSHNIIDQLFKTAEDAMAKPLSSSELSTIYSFYDWLRLPIEVIEALLQHCSENNHRNINYIEKIAIDWSEKGIDTLDKVADNLQNSNKVYREVLKSLGQASRNITPKEITFVDKWIKEQNHSLDIILEACDKTIINTGKANFRYLDKILTEWFDNNIKTIDDVIKSETNYKETKPIKTLEIKKPAKFSNFTTETSEYDQLDNLNLNLLRKQRL
jgi:DnaD/phage-associated family protein